MLLNALINPGSSAALDFSFKGLTTEIQEIKCLKIFLLHLLFFKLAHSIIFPN